MSKSIVSLYANDVTHRSRQCLDVCSYVSALVNLSVVSPQSKSAAEEKPSAKAAAEAPQPKTKQVFVPYIRTQCPIVHGHSYYCVTS
jgi:hypothetical protein